MTKFEDGPAAGRYLELRRLPLFLRVVIDADGQIDALDQLEDEPWPGEALYAYRRAGEPGTVHIDRTDPVTKRRVGEWRQYARYRLCAEQPDAESMRDRGLWQQWCGAAKAKENA